MSQQTFDTIDVARLQIEDDWPGLPNIVPNPTAEFGAWGWSNKGTGALSVVAGPAFHLQRGTFASPDVRTDPLQIVPSGGTNMYVRGSLRRFDGLGTVGFNLRFSFLDAAYGVVSTSAATANQTTNGTMDTGQVLVPSTAKFCRLIVTMANDATSGNWVQFTDAAVTNGTSAETATAPTVEPGWVDLLSPATEIEIVREELNLGTLTAVVRDSTIDPATSDVIRKGKIVRALALDNGTGLWELLFRGEAHVADVTYDLLYPDTAKRARINIQAVDPIQVLAAIPRSGSVGTMSELRETLAGTRVPFNVNGSPYPYTLSPTITATADNASALDQVAITRDTVRGYAWMSRRGVLTAWDRASIPATVAAVLDEDDYTDLGLGYSTADLLNDVSIIVREIDMATGETVETRYGPYSDEISVREHGRSHADFTVTAVGWTESNAAAYAAAILATNPVPRVRVHTLRVPVKTAAHITPARALLDLYDKVTVNNTASGIAQDLRITRITHRLEPKKWTIDLGFAEVGGVASPQVVPPVPPSNAAIPGAWTSYTPTASGSVNNFTSYTSSGYFRVLDHKTVAFTARVTITNAGAAVNEAIILGLPFAHINGIETMVVGRENAVVGTMMQGIINGGANYIFGFSYNNQGITATNHTYVFSGVYQRQ